MDNSNENATKSVCIVGAGVCGIVAVKICLEAGFDVTCYDKSNAYGGLWHYVNDKKDSNSSEERFSVMRTTILNTSKELSAFSDYPPPPHLPNFMKHEAYMDYIKSYAEHFNLLPHLKLSHETIHCEPELDPTTNTVKWSVDIRDIKENRQFNRKFDKLMVAIGRHNVPFIPKYPGQEKFKGKIYHTYQVKDILTDERFIDKRVVVVGLGNSACDAANDLALVAKKCYVSTHRGNWFASRLTANGPHDFHVRCRYNYYRTNLLPTATNDKRYIKQAEKTINHEYLGLKPKHKPSEYTPTINDLFPYRVFTGGIIMKGSLLRFTEDGVVFEGEEDEVEDCEVDAVVLATGYNFKVPFMNERELGIKSIEDNLELYLNIFAPRLSIPKVSKNPCMEAVKSLAFIGLVQPSGSTTVFCELQCRLATLVFEGKRQLPSIDEMIADIKRLRARQAASLRSHSQDQLVGSWISYCDLIASKIGVKPNMSKLFFKDIALWKQLMFGPSVPYQYRLFGPGAWPKARETILTVNERVALGVNEGKNVVLYKVRSKSLKEREQQKQKQRAHK